MPSEPFQTLLCSQISRGMDASALCVPGAGGGATAAWLKSLRQGWVSLGHTGGTDRLATGQSSSGCWVDLNSSRGCGHPRMFAQPSAFALFSWCFLQLGLEVVIEMSTSSEPVLPTDYLVEDCMDSST